MASGYIGKISAIVTANTSDLSRKLSQSSAEANKFATSLKTSIDRAGTNAQKSLEKIFTPLQQLERKLKAASFRSLDLKLPVDNIRAFVSAAEEINKPLERAAGGFSKLSTEVQAALIPALNAAQDAALSVNRQIENTGGAAQKSFDDATAAARRFEAASRAALQAQEIAGRGLTGSELQFRSPAAFSALTRTADLTKRVGGLPSSALEDGNLRGKVEQLNRISSRIQAAFANIENLELTGAPAAQIDAAREKLQRLANVARQGQDELEALADKFDPLAQKKTGAAADTLQERPQRLEDASRLLTILSDSEVQASKAKQATTAYRDEVTKLSDKFASFNNKAFFDSAALGSASAKLDRLRLILSGVSSEARGPAVQAFERYSAAVIEATQNGEAGLVRNRRQLQALENDAIEAAAATNQVGSAQAIGRQLARAGDIGRIGIDKISLGLQQAAFAVDDFFSVTGGIEQQVRAFGNNVTQLGFIVGETKGLFIALGVVLAAQFAIFVAKSIGVLEDQEVVLDAVNGTLREQKDRVEQLARAYDQLANSVRDSGLTEIGRTQADRRRQRAEIERLEKERQVDVKASVDPEFRELTVQRSALLNRLNTATGLGERAAIDAELRLLEPRIAAARIRAAARPASGRSVEQVLIDQARLRSESEAQSAAREAGGNDNNPAAKRRAEEMARIEFENRASEVRGIGLGTSEEQLRALQSAISELQQRIARENRLGSFFADSQLVSELDDQLQTLIREQADFEARVREALPAAVFGRTFDRVQVAADGLDRASANVDESGLGGGRIDRELTLANESANALLAQAQEARAQGDLELARTIEESALGLQAWASQIDSAANAAAIFADTLKRLGDDLSQTVVQEARSRADSARRRANADPSDPFLSRQRRRAEEEARRAEQQARENQEATIALRQQFEDDAIAGRLGPEIQALVNERETLQADIESGRLSAEEERAARRRQREIDAELNERFEDSPQGREASAAADRADQDAALFAQLQESERRGRDLMLTDGERAARETAQKLDDIRNASLARVAAGEDVDTVLGELKNARARTLDDARRSVAPALFALQDAVANAVLQGPSRAALNAADVTTTQGTAELNRLLRGDDSARDQNLLELQKQTAELQRLNTNLENNGVAD